jgi:hypothetical protein
MKEILKISVTVWGRVESFAGFYESAADERGVRRDKSAWNRE